MARAIVLAGVLLLFAGTASAEEYVTTRDKLMCKTQQSLREALKAIEAKDRPTLRTVQGCLRSVEGAGAEVIQDSVSMLKIRLVEGREEYWILPDTVKPANRR